VLQIEPEDSTSRWALIRTLLHRGDLKEAWRALHEAPQPLDPSNTTDARAWIQLHRRRGQPVETVAGCLRLLRRFGDDEQFSATALINLMLPSPTPVELPSGLRAQLTAETERFFERWPDSPHLRRFQTADLEQLRTDMIAMARRGRDQQLQWRRLVHGLARDQLGDVATETAPNNGVTHYTYDTNGYQLSITDATGAQTQETYDYLGNRITATQVERQPTSAAYTTTYAYTSAAAGCHRSPPRPGSRPPTATTPPVGFQNPEPVGDLGFYAARSYSMISPPGTDLRLTSSVGGPTADGRLVGAAAAGPDADGARCSAGRTRRGFGADVARRG
jgi:YD repeat-containing protein